MPNSLQLTLFGSPEVRRHGQPVTGFRTGKAQALLYYLAVTGRPHTRASLAGLLWGDQPEDAARASLSKCLSNLRDLLGDAVLIERQTVALNRDYPYELDTERFAAAVGQPPTVATSQSLQAALALYRGDLLEGFYVREAPDFEQWLLVQRAHYREAVITGLQALAGFHAQGGDLPGAITSTRRLLALEPWREEAHRQLMMLLTRSGQRTAALAQFETCRRILAEDLAVEPAAETVALVEAIRAGEIPTQAGEENRTQKLLALSPPSAASVETGKNNLPLPISSFIGRQRELGEVQTLLTAMAVPKIVMSGNAPGSNTNGRPIHKLVTLTGAGGSGKTRLAIQSATNLLANYQDGVWWVDLAPLRDDKLVPQAIAKALGVRERPNQPIIETLTDHLLTKQTLCVLDNCERLIDACAQLAHTLITRCPHLQMMATSREPLGISGERIYQVPTLALPAPNTALSSADLLGYAAIQLFVERAQAMEASFALTQANAATVQQICRQLEGIPLAIELAAARVRVLSLDQIALRLSDRLHLLTTGSRTAPPRHQTLRATLDWSYDLLSTGERLLFRRLAIFVGGFPLEACEEVCVPLPSPVLDLLTYLVDKSLVTVEQTEQGIYYRLLEIVREYAREKLLASGEIEALRLRHLNFFMRVAEAAYERFHLTQREHWLTWCEQIHDNIRIALRRATESDKRIEALRLAAATGLFWEVRGYWREGRQWLAQTLQLSEDTGVELDATSNLRRWMAMSLQRAGAMTWRQCDFAGARILLEKSLVLDRKLDQWDGIGSTLGLLGGVAFEQGDYTAAQAYYTEFLAASHTWGAKHMIGMANFCLGLVACQLGDYGEAQTHLNESLKLFRDSGNSDIHYTLNALGTLANLQSDYAAAHHFYAECLHLRRQLGDKRGVAATLCDIANVTAKQGDRTTAQALYWESLGSFCELGNERGVVCALSGLARLWQTQGHPLRAAQLLAAVAALLKALNARLDEPEASDSAQAIAHLRTQLDETTFNTAWQQGEQLTLEQAITLARQGEPTNA